MAKPRELKRRIRSVEKTRQITRTMEMVATSKMKRARERVVAARPYASALADVVADLYAPELAEQFPLLRQPEEPHRRAALVLITSNRGLCGAFNGNLIREGRRRLEAFEAAGTAVDLHLVGKKGIGFFRFLGTPITSQRTDVGDRPTPDHAAEIVEPFTQLFTDGTLDAVDVIYAEHKGGIATPPAVLRVLPVPPPAGGTTTLDYLLRPSAGAILEVVLPLYVRNLVYRALVETAAAEQVARRIAMKNATDNAGEMIDRLRRTYNRARQALITTEIAEIVGGAEALKG